MFITLTQLHDEEAPFLQPVIPNKDGKIGAALRGLNYEVGYHNIKRKQEITLITIRDLATGPEYEHYYIHPRHHSLKELIQTIKDTIPGISIGLAEETN